MPQCLAGILGISTTNQHKKQPQAAARRWCPVPRHDDTKIHAVFEAFPTKYRRNSTPKLVGLLGAKKANGERVFGCFCWFLVCLNILFKVNKINTTKNDHVFFEEPGTMKKSRTQNFTIKRRPPFLNRGFDNLFKPGV